MSRFLAKITTLALASLFTSLPAFADPGKAIAEGAEFISQDFEAFENPYASEQRFTAWVSEAEVAHRDTEVGDLFVSVIQPPSPPPPDMSVTLNVSVGGEGGLDTNLTASFFDSRTRFDSFMDSDGGFFGTGREVFTLEQQAVLFVGNTPGTDGFRVGGIAMTVPIASVGGDVIITGQPKAIITAFKLATGAASFDASFATNFAAEIEVGVRAFMNIAEDVPVSVEIKSIQVR